MKKTESSPESPLYQWWSNNHFLINESCLAVTSNPTAAASLRRLLRHAAEGAIPLDDKRLRGVVGELIKTAGVVVIQEHRAWMNDRGGVQ